MENYLIKLVARTKDSLSKHYSLDDEGVSLVMNAINAVDQANSMNEDLVKLAAHVVASLYAHDSGLNFTGLSQDARDGLEDLCKQLDTDGYLDIYKKADGSLSIWGET